MKKSNREKRKAGIGNVTEIAICDTLDERTLRSRQVERIEDQISDFSGLSKFARLASVTMHQED